MGTVYLAERADGEVIQRAAIKLLRYAGDDSCRLERFLRERQMLASINHPNIARLLDAGHRANGEPYLVMEYVEGERVDEYGSRLRGGGARTWVCRNLAGRWMRTPIKRRIITS